MKIKFNGGGGSGSSGTIIKILTLYFKVIQ